MTRFYFDYTKHNRAMYDFEGAEFQDLRGAIEFAETIAQDFKSCSSGAWIGWSIEVLNAQGEKFHSLRIESAAVIALPAIDLAVPIGLNDDCDFLARCPDPNRDNC